MKRTTQIGWKLTVPLLIAATTGCSDGDSDDSMGQSGETGSEMTLDPQVPPTNSSDMKTWLEKFESEGWEAEWECEPEATDKTDGVAAIHVHGKSNRVCSNVALSQVDPGSSVVVPEGSAALKFVEDGIYVTVKTAPKSDDGENWYFYAPGGAVADFGAKECVGCHSAAGSDADHPGLGDFVYFQVEP